MTDSRTCRRRYLTLLGATGAGLVGGCSDLGGAGAPGDGAGTDGNATTAENETVATETGGETGGLDQPRDLLVENGSDEEYTLTVTVQGAEGVVFERDVTLTGGSSAQFEAVVTEPGEYTVEATRNGGTTAYVWVVTPDAGDLRIAIQSDGSVLIADTECCEQ